MSCLVCVCGGGGGGTPRSCLAKSFRGPVWGRGPLVLNVPTVPLRQHREYPLDRMGYPLIVQRVPQTAADSIHCAVGGTPLAVTQEDFLFEQALKDSSIRFTLQKKKKKMAALAFLLISSGFGNIC